MEEAGDPDGEKVPLGQGERPGLGDGEDPDVQGVRERIVVVVSEGGQEGRAARSFSTAPTIPPTISLARETCTRFPALNSRMTSAMIATPPCRMRKGRRPPEGPGPFVGKVDLAGDDVGHAAAGEEGGDPPPP